MFLFYMFSASHCKWESYSHDICCLICRYQYAQKMKQLTSSSHYIIWDIKVLIALGHRVIKTLFNFIITDF